MRHRQFEMLIHDLGRGYEFHRLRHTFALEQLRSGTPLQNVSKMIGHTRIEQTLRNAKRLEKDVIDAGNSSASQFTAALMPRSA